MRPRVNHLIWRPLVKNDSRFNKPLASTVNEEAIDIDFEGQTITVQKGDNLAAALLTAGIRDFRYTLKDKVQKAPFCMMILSPTPHNIFIYTRRLGRFSGRRYTDKV